MASIRNSMRAAAAGLHRFSGVAWYHFGAYERARRSFQRVLELRGDDFSSYVYLGRLAYSLGDYAGWRRECEHARRTSPERFARLKHPFELHQTRPVGTVFEEAGERASWRLYRVGQLGSSPSMPHLPGLRPLSELRPDDFSSPAERMRFRSMQPLRTEDIRTVDLDDLARRLSS